MSDLFWPGYERAGSMMTDGALLDAMVAVEAGWLAALVAAGIAPSAAADDLAGLAGDADIEQVATAAEAGGNPVIPLVELLRSRVSQRNAYSGRWLHRGLTSQDVLDTALMLCSRAALNRLLTDIGAQVSTLAHLAEQHRSTLMVGRTLTQHAVPITFGLKAASWLTGVLDAADDLLRVRALLPVQAGGAAGTAAAATELARLAGATDPARTAVELADDLATRLGLSPATPWHTSRRPITRLGDALVAGTDAFGRLANDVLTLSRPELGELSEAARSGRGGSSTMPQKQNPVLAVLIRRAALSAPAFAAQLHTAAAVAGDERPDGGWHAEWASLRSLTRMTVVASSQVTELLEDLVVHADRMRARLDSVAPELLAEQRSMASVFGDDGKGGATAGPAGYLGASDLFVSAMLDRAARFGKEVG
jgi:3-carboxy-cis,cis-muconate cycloisomerase